MELKLKFICAIEPNAHLAGELDQALGNLGVEYHIIQSFFNNKFNFDDELSEKFDLILFSHSLYSFQDPWEVVLHSANFLKPDGKILILISGSSCIFLSLKEYVASKSDPNIYSISKCIASQNVTGEMIIRHSEKSRSSLSTLVMEEFVYLNVDDFVRKTGASGCSDAISFFLQVEVERLSEGTKEQIYRKVADKCVVRDGKYCLTWPNFGIVVSKCKGLF